MLLDVPRAERDLRPYPVDPGDVRVGDELDRPLARHELSELVDRPELDVHAACREEQPVDVARAGVGDVLVERLAVSVERVEGVLVLRERPVAARDALHAVSGSTSSSTVNARPASRSVSLREDGAAAERDDRRLAVAEHAGGDLLLELAEAGLAARGEEVGDGRARRGARSRRRGRRTGARAAPRRPCRRSSSPSP